MIAFGSIWVYEEDVSLMNTYITMSLGTVYSEYLDPGSIDTYYFTPSESGMYVVKTLGSTNTMGRIFGATNTLSTTDDDSGQGTNFSIEFYQEEGTTATINVWHANSPTGSGNYSIQVRKPKAQIYTFDYGENVLGVADINTIPDAVEAKSALESIGYEVEDNRNQTAAHAMATISGSHKRFNSEIVFFSGHGTSNGGGILFANGNILTDLNIGTTGYLGSDGMSNTKVAVWSACESAAIPNDSVPRISITEKACEMGAKVSIGWKEKIDVDYAKKWTDAFWKTLGDGKTVNEALGVANGVIPSESDALVKSLEVLGDKNVVITLCNTNATTVSQSSITSKFNVVSESEFDDFLEEFEGNYIEEDYKGIYTCYYKTINGYKTNEYYKVFNGSIKKMSVSITKEEIEEAEKLVLRETQYKIPEENEFGKLAEIQDEYILYMKFKGEIIPVKTVEAVYENALGHSKLETICINLLDDTLLDYEEIWGL